MTSDYAGLSTRRADSQFPRDGQLMRIRQRKFKDWGHVLSKARRRRTIEDALLAYDTQRPLCVEYALKLADLFGELLTQEAITFQAIEQRAKSIESLREKLARPGKSYQNGLAEITDLCGLRIITYALDDVIRVCDLIHREFRVIPEHTIDKGAILGSAEFG